MSEIAKIVENIKETCLNRGKDGLLELCEKFDKVKMSTLKMKVPDVKIADELKEAIKIGVENITKFHKAEYSRLIKCNEKIETSKGLVCWKRFTAIENVGLYVPNKLFSSILMNVIPAKICGCEKITVCTPPNPSNEILWTLKYLGIDEIYTIGGAQAIFAMAYGIGEVPKVDKIFGPGNEFVDTAKKMVSNEVAIDMPAGPSEVLVIADENANHIATTYDLLAQLEHGRASKAWLLTTSQTLADFVNKNIEEIAKKSDRWWALECSLKNLKVEVFNNLEDAVEVSNNYAPEHLIINTRNARELAKMIKNAGSVFVGSNTGESLGDYLSGTNHVLPTGGFAKMFSGLSVLSFGKFITFQEATKDGLAGVQKQVKSMALAEGLGFHAKSVDRYLQDFE